MSTKPIKIIRRHGGKFYEAIHEPYFVKVKLFPK